MTNESPGQEPTKEESEAADRAKEQVSDEAMEATKESYEKGAQLEGEGKPENPGS